jgi:hypothetical protein
VFSRRLLKWGLLPCVFTLAAVVFFQLEWPLRVTEMHYLLGTGSAVSVVAICIALIATI